MGLTSPTQPLHLTGSPTFTGDYCPQQTPLPARLSPAVPEGMGLWHVQDGDQQHCSSTLRAGDKESSPRDHLSPGLVRLWHCDRGQFCCGRVPAVMLLPQPGMRGPHVSARHVAVTCRGPGGQGGQPAQPYSPPGPGLAPAVQVAWVPALRPSSPGCAQLPPPVQGLELPGSTRDADGEGDSGSPKS